MGLFGRPKSPDVGGASSPSSSSSLAAYDAMVAEHLPPLRAAAAAASASSSTAGAAALGLEAPTARVEAAFAAQRAAVASAAASASGRPLDSAALQALLAPVAAEMTAAASDADRAPPRAPAGLAAKAAAEALQSLAWLALPPPAVVPSPAQHVADAWSAAEFYANKLLMEARGLGAAEGEAVGAWTRALRALVTGGLRGYVAAHHARGLAFGGGVAGAGAAGGAAAPATAVASAAGAATAAAAPKRAGPPRPPPPPPPGGPPPTSALLSERKGAAAPAAAAAAAPAAVGMSAVLASLNRGTAVTSGLRKVTDDMKTKNRTPTAAVPASASAPAPPSSTTAAAAAAKPTTAAAAPPRVELEQDRCWVVENHTAATTRGEPLVVRVTNPRHAVYVRACSGPGCVVRVEGRVASLAVDSCRRVGVVFDEVVASAEVVNCASVQLQCLGSARTVSVDKTDGCQVFVPARLAKGGSGGATSGAGGGGGCSDFQLVTAKSSEVNVTLMPGEEDGEDADAVEHAVPEQFVSTFGADGKLTTAPVSHGGG